MAKAHSKLKTCTTKEQTLPPQQRLYTVGYTPNGGKTHPSPQLNIKGRWLEQLGFHTGMPVTVKTEQGKLIIELAR